MGIVFLQHYRQYPVMIGNLNPQIYGLDMVIKMKKYIVMTVLHYMNYN